MRLYDLDSASKVIGKRISMIIKELTYEQSLRIIEKIPIEISSVFFK